MSRGYVHLYTGNGKGKTTAAIGLCIRAIGAGKRVLFVQFIKSGHFSEIKALEQFADQISIHQFGLGRKEMRNNTQKTAEIIQEGFTVVKNAVSQQLYDLIVLDEVCIAIHKEFLDFNLLRAMISGDTSQTEWVLTGRYATDEIIAFSDLCSRIEPVKHYYEQGVPARKGIEF